MQLLLLRSDDHPGLKNFMSDKRYLSPEVINKLVSLMGRYVLKSILSSVNNTRLYSIISDEVSDVSHKEQLCITLRWVSDDFEIFEKPVEIIYVPKTDSATITALIKDCLIRFSLPIAHCRGQAYDGAANMSGHITGVAKRIEEEEPTAIFVHCLAHSITISA